MLLRWSPSVTLCTDGPPELSSESAAQLARHRVHVREERVARLDVVQGQLRRVVLEGSDAVEAEALFLCLGHEQRSDLVAALGVELMKGGVVDSSRAGATNIDGVYAVGDASRDPQFVITAAAEGAAAAVSINKRLTLEALKTGRSPHD
jgi:thioredoxin reductase